VLSLIQHVGSDVDILHTIIQFLMVYVGIGRYMVEHLFTLFNAFINETRQSYWLGPGEEDEYHASAVQGPLLI